MFTVSAQPTTSFTKITTGAIATNSAPSWSAAWGDFDNDGFIDLIIGNVGADWLYRNNGDGTFTRITTGPVVANTMDEGAGVAFADYDNDGHLDLVVGGFGGPPTQLFRNHGDGTFTKLTGNPPAASGNAMSTNWGDYDNDGYVDLMVTMYGPANLLYHNNGNGSFTKMSAAIVGSIAVDSGRSSAGIWGDYDNDGDLDMFITRLNAKNVFYRNNGHGTFTKLMRVDIWDLDDVASHYDGPAWADYDNDGDLDLFIPQGGGASLANDALYRNNGNGSFTKLTAALVGPLVNDREYGSDCAWADYDNDGWLDLYVTNPGSYNGVEAGRKNLLYHNNGDGSFTQVTTGSPANDVEVSTGCVWGDYDNDGFLDLFVANGGFAGRKTSSLYRNNGNSRAWLKLKLIGTVSNRSAIGARVRVRATIDGKSLWQLREISGGQGFSQDDLRPNFGLGDASVAEIVRIEWPSGIVQELHNVTANQILTLTEPPKFEPAVTLSNSRVELKLKSWKSFVFQIEASSDLKEWENLTTLTNETGTLTFSVPASSSAAQQFYRGLTK